MISVTWLNSSEDFFYWNKMQQRLKLNIDFNRNSVCGSFKVEQTKILKCYFTDWPSNIPTSLFKQLTYVCITNRARTVIIFGILCFKLYRLHNGGSSSPGNDPQYSNQESAIQFETNLRDYTRTRHIVTGQQHLSKKLFFVYLFIQQTNWHSGAFGIIICL